MALKIHLKLADGIYQAAGMPKPSLSDLNPDFVRKTQAASNPHLAIEALRKMLTEESARATRNNVIRQRALSERIVELMTKYTNQQLTSAEIIAEMVEFAKEIAAEGNRSAHFKPALSEDELAIYDAVALNESAVQEQGEGVLCRDRTRAGRGDASGRADGLDCPRRRPCQAAVVHQTAARQTRLPAGQAACRDQAGDGADGVHGCSLRGSAPMMSFILRDRVVAWGHRA